MESTVLSRRKAWAEGINGCEVTKLNVHEAKWIDIVSIDTLMVEFMKSSSS
jgi:hypothetical protein